MKTLLTTTLLLAALTLTTRAAQQVKISDLPIIASPSTNTFIEVADMNEVTKSRKYLLTNLVTQSQLAAAGGTLWTNSAGTVQLIDQSNTALKLSAHDGGSGGPVELWSGGIKRWSMGAGILYPESNYDLGSSLKPVQTIWLGALTGVALGNRNIFSGAATPEGVHSAEVGSLFLRTDGSSGTTLYTKVSGAGNTGWEALGGGGASLWDDTSGLLQPLDLTLQPLVNTGWFIGTNAPAYWGGNLTIGESLIAARVVSEGDPNFNQFEFAASDDVLASNYASFGGYMSTNQLNTYENLVDANGSTGWQTLVTTSGGSTVSKTALVGGVTVGELNPTVADGVGNAAWTFGTDKTLTDGAFLGVFQNNGTNRVTIAPEASVHLGGTSIITSGLTDNATNVAIVVGTSTPWTGPGSGAQLLTLGDSEPAFRVRSDGGVWIGKNSYQDTALNTPTAVFLNAISMVLSNEPTSAAISAQVLSSEDYDFSSFFGWQGHADTNSAYGSLNLNSDGATGFANWQFNVGTESEFAVRYWGSGGDRFSIRTNGMITLSGTTNQIVFGATNTAPVSAVAPTKWISVQVSGESAIYRVPLYE